MNVDTSRLLQSAAEIFLQLADVYEQNKQEKEHELDLRFSKLEAEQGQRFSSIESRVDHIEATATENREAIKATLEAILSRL